MSLEEVAKFQDEGLFARWLSHPGLGLVSTVGLPRVRLLFAKVGSCLYPVGGKPCARRFDFEEDLYQQVERRKQWDKPDIQDIHCVSVDNGTIGIIYTEDAGLGNLLSSACFRCQYPRNGYVLDIPKPDLRRETYGHYHKMCLSSVGSKVIHYYLDDTTRLIQYDFTVYDEMSDVYVRVTLAFENLDMRQWWFVYSIETAYFRGFCGRGNYHGLSDDAKTLLLPLLTILLTCCIAGFIVRLAMITRRPYGRHAFKLLLCAAAIGLCACRVYFNVEAALQFDSMVQQAYNEAPPETQAKLTTRESRAEYLRSQFRHLPFARLVQHNRYAREAAVGMLLLTVLQICLYNNYHWNNVTVIIVSVRRAVRYVLGFLVCFFVVNFFFAVVGHTMFGKCSASFSEKTVAYLRVFSFQLVGGLEHQDLERCRPVWGPIFYVVSVLVLSVVLFNFTYEYMLGVMSEVRQQRAQEAARGQQQLQVEYMAWPLTRCGRRYKLPMDRLHLIWLYDFLTSRPPTPT
ncbi:polycystin-2 [Cherax quadricarinatus]|uniref:polycystin-2 n=1 Tax=Cherax quadricarinatus TaxID=27406 RepID=UPI002378A92B|nr:uncharacterized protein LOC128692533 [Cherax quadricarinatus]